MKRSEIVITKEVSEKVFTDTGNFIEQVLGGKLSRRSNGLEQKYLEYKVGEEMITLHWEHYLGISVFGENSSETERILRKIALEFLRN